MNITINNIKGEKRIDLSYSIQNFDSDKEIAIIRMLSDNVKYEILKLPDAKYKITDISLEDRYSTRPHEIYFRHEKDFSKWNLCR